MEDRAGEVLSALKNPNLHLDAKVAHITKLKSDIKRENVPEGAASTVFDAVRASISSPHQGLSAVGFSTLGHLIKRLSLQDQKNAIARESRHTLPILLDRLGDHKERVRSQASQAFTDFWPAAPMEVEHYVLEIALNGKNTKAKETSMVWLVYMTRECGLLFRAFVPSLVSCLEDADSGVRETAKSTVIELFQNAPPKAQSDLKKQLHLHSVRKSIVIPILSSIGMQLDTEIPSSMHSLPRPGSGLSYRSHEPPRPNSVLSHRSHDASNHTVQPRSQKPDPPRRDRGLSQSETLDPNPTRSNPSEFDRTVEPILVASHREFDDIVKSMLYDFEGRESEANWLHREKHIATLRRLTTGNAPADYHSHYVAGIRSLLDGILKVVHSLRTTLSTAGCLLVQEIAHRVGPALDPVVEILLQSMIKVCSSLKKIAADNGNRSVDAVIGSVSYSPRIMQHLWACAQDRNVNPRLFNSGWLKTMMSRHSGHKSVFEHGGGLDLLEKCIKKGLSDANPGVREGMRGTYWVFARIWNDRAEGIMSILDTKSRSLLEKDPGNIKSKPSDATGNSTYGRTTLKETIAAQKRARMATTKAPHARPESAQSTFAEVKPTNKSSSTFRTTSTVRSVPIGTHASQTSTLSSAPMRPGARARRPEPPRPATADPYSRRPLHAKESSPMASPPKARPKSTITPARPKSRIESAFDDNANDTPVPPKSRVDSAPFSGTKTKPKRLDIAALKAAGRVTKTASADVSPPGAIFDTSQPLVSPIDSNRAPFAEPKIDDTPMTDDEHSTKIKAIELTTTGAPESNALIPSSRASVTSSMSRTSPVSHRRLNSDSSAQTTVSPYKVSSSPANGHISSLSSNRCHNKTNSDGMMHVPHISTPRGSSSAEEHHVPVPFEAPTVTTALSTSADSTNIMGPTSTTSIIPHASALPVLPVAPISLVPETVKVYEDPQSPASREGRADAIPIQKLSQTPSKSNPLEELPINEPTPTSNRRLNRPPETSPVVVSVPDGENTRRQWKKAEVAERRRSLSPRSKDPSRARDMIDRGLNKIQSSAIDVHGYRKFQSLIKYHESILADEVKYGEILIALLQALETPEMERKGSASRALDLKTQVLVTIRLMLSLNKIYFSAHYAQAMTAIITARRHYEITNHIVSGLEETAEQVVAACDPPVVMDAVLDLLETEELTPEGLRMSAMGSYILAGLIHRLNEKNLILTETELQRLGLFAKKKLCNPQPDVRRAAINFCLELHEMVQPEDAFWNMVNSRNEDFRPLLTYYIVRKPTRTQRE